MTVAATEAVLVSASLACRTMTEDSIMRFDAVRTGQLAGWLPRDRTPAKASVEMAALGMSRVGRLVESTQTRMERFDAVSVAAFSSSARSIQGKGSTWLLLHA